MAVWHGKSRRLFTGGLRRTLRARMKRKYEMGRITVHTVLADEEERKVIRVRGGNYKVRVRKAAYANVADPKTGTVKKVKILSLVENRAHRHFIRSGVITKGAIIETELGKARVTSRPNQHGVVNAVLIQ
ncbi:MAG: small subunit ribosomal protein S8e [Candidatus Diapherotrites archaeon]|nr:small subunit ribosomal protein S8e [Candidatus Diapherotrites archaeon]MDN5367088.1 small subunit ribosomal protein S8e [Candidatus Diapherotrites archaeon]